MISVIMPVYKAARYLDRSISSVLNQTFTDFELLLVDDGSPDNCGALCDEWANKDSRIKVIHKQNGGVSDARNHGVRMAQGEYIAFIDSDDFVKPEWLHDMYTVAKETNADLVKSGFVQFTENNSDTNKSVCDFDVKFTTEKRFENEQITPYEFHCRLLTDFSYSPVWNQLVKADIQKNCPFAVGKHNEDYLCFFSILDLATNIQVIDSVAYCYGFHEESITNSPTSSFSSDLVGNSAEHSKLFITKYNDKERAEQAIRGALIYFFYHTIGSENINYREYSSIKKTWNDIRSTVKLIDSESVVPPEVYTQYCLCKISLFMYITAVKIKKLISKQS